jgi:cytochrome c oxidase subunit 1
MSDAVLEQSAPTPRSRVPLWRRLLGFNALLGFALGVGGWFLGHWIGTRITIGMDSQVGTDQNDVAIFMGYFLALLGWLIGLGFANYPLSRFMGRPPALREKEQEGPGRYWRLCTDHKVVGLQYFVTVLLFFLIAGLNAMFIRAELMTPNEKLWNANQYLSLVSLHGTMMLMMMSAGILGPFANYFVPIMIGARRMAFPRLESLSFWLVPPAGLILLSAVAFGGFPTGWTGYAPLANEARAGMDAYLFSFGLIGLSMTIVGTNMIATVMTMRAPGMTWRRLPIFVWGVLCTSILMVLAAPVLFATLVMVTLDRTADTSFFLASAGGSPFLYDNLFWFFGHPEVYILALPGFGLVLEILPVFSRKPLWGYRLAVAGMLGVTLLSFMVWQHHLFVSGINADLRPFYMLTTELISIPTGFIFLNGLGTLWRGRIRFTVPMLFALAFFSNFLLGGLSGVFLSDVPSDVSTHGSYFVMAHFHYTIMGGLVFALFAGVYYWLPKMTGLKFNELLAKIHFWGMFVFFNCTFAPLFAAGMLGMPRRVSIYAPRLQGINVFVSISAFMLGLSMLVFLVNLVYSMVIARVPAEANPWRSRGIEFQLPTPVPVTNFERTPVIQADPYGYGEPNAVPVAAFAPAGAAVAEGSSG